MVASSSERRHFWKKIETFFIWLKGKGFRLGPKIAPRFSSNLSIGIITTSYQNPQQFLGFSMGFTSDFTGPIILNTIENSR